ncbi:uncharacterized protein [Elaeis guineensis]|uniref:uncharacterized protein n=1 Tax=Elaeis guineensis var. tenera TaxID=51953 RepID=UPI003C6D770D
MHEDYFNMKHSAVRNCIERCFGILKTKWATMRTKSYYPVKTQCRVISACALLHNYIRGEMSIDPMEIEAGEGDVQGANNMIDYIDHVETNNAWSGWRNALAEEMFNNWMGNHP